MLIDDDVLMRFRYCTTCEICHRRVPEGCTPHHYQTKGVGGGSQIDAEWNLLAVCHWCHREIHDGHVPRRKQLEIIAQREDVQPEEITRRIHEHLSNGSAGSRPRIFANGDSAMEVKDVRISHITIGTRHRKELGDLDELAESIERDTLLQPIGVTKKNELVFGFRRLAACRDKLSWKTIPARIVEIDKIVMGEYAENEFRKDFTPTERSAIVDELRSYSHGGDRKSDQNDKSRFENVTVDDAAKKAGFSGAKEYQRVKSVVANGTPSLQDAMDAGKVSISDAAAVAKETPAKQVKAVAKIEAGEAPTLRQAVGKTAKRDNGKPTANHDKTVTEAFGRLMVAVDAQARYFGCVTKHDKVQETPVHMAVRSAMKVWKEWSAECAKEKG